MRHRPNTPARREKLANELMMHRVTKAPLRALCFGARTSIYERQTSVKVMCVSSADYRGLFVYRSTQTQIHLGLHEAYQRALPRRTQYHLGCSRPERILRTVCCGPFIRKPIVPPRLAP